MTSNGYLELEKCIISAFGRNGELCQAFLNALQRDFLEPLKKKLQTITFRRLIARKNPYLYRTSGITSMSSLVERALTDFVSSSVEGLFGKAMEHFATALPGCLKSSARGVDIEKRSGNGIELFAIKSGPAGYNSSIMRSQRKDLADARGVLQQQRGLMVTTYIGFTYGRKRRGEPREGIVALSSKELWEKLSGDPRFYERLLSACACVSGLYQADIENASIRLQGEAHKEFLDEHNNINWPEILKASSG